MAEPRATPPGKSGALGFLALAALALGLLYLANLGGGTSELLPDHAPLWGNLDELGASALAILALQYLFGRGRSR